MIIEKGCNNHLAPGLIIVDEDSSLSKYSADATTEIVIRKIYIEKVKSKL